MRAASLHAKRVRREGERTPPLCLPRSCIITIIRARAHVCAPGTLPRVGDRGNRHEGKREGRGRGVEGERKEGRKDGRTDGRISRRAEKWMGAHDGKEGRDVRERQGSP